MAHPLDGLFPHPEQTGGHLGDHVVVVWAQAVMIATLSRAGEAVPGRSARALARMVWMLTDPKLIPPP